MLLQQTRRFHLRWRESPERQIDSYAPPKGCLAKPGMANHERDHSRFYVGFGSVKVLGYDQFFRLIMLWLVLL